MQQSPSSWLIVQVDGTPGDPHAERAAVGVVVRTPDGRVIGWHTAEVPARTSNEAEYHAVLVGLEFVRRCYGAVMVYCVSDSRVVVEQMTGRCRVYAGPLQILHGRAQLAVRTLAGVEFVQVPRELNRLADALAWEALGGQRALVRTVRLMARPDADAGRRER